MRQHSLKIGWKQILFPILFFAICGFASAQSFNLTVKTQGFGSGKVVVNKESGVQVLSCLIQPASTCTQSLPAGNYILVGTPDPNNTFQGWSGGSGSLTSCNSLNTPCSFTLNADSSVFGTFNSPAKLTLRVTGPGKATFRMDNGSFITCESGNTLAEGFFMNSQVRITAVPDTGANFIAWNLISGSPAGAMCAAQSTICNFVIDKAIFVEAKFGTAPPPSPPPPPPSVAVRALKSGSGTGTVIDNHGMNCGSNCTSSVPSGTSVVLKFTPAANSTFKKWTAATGSASVCNESSAKLCAFTATQNSSITAVFDLTP